MKKLAITILLLLLAGCSVGQLNQEQVEKLLANIIQDIKSLGKDVQVLDHRTRILLPPTPVPTAAQVVSKPLPTVHVE